MRPKNGLKIIESCLTCSVRNDRLLCNLSPRALSALDTITTPALYPKGAKLFDEGQSPRGVFILCSGRLKLFASSAEGKSLILRIADAGEVVGVPATVSGQPYEVSAEVLEPAQANFISRDDFLRFLSEHGEVALRVAQLLGEICHKTYQEVRSLGLSRSSAQKLARFLLDWSSRPGHSQPDGRVSLALTHEEIAQSINTSRETVTRTLTDLKNRELIYIQGSALTIRDRAALENLAE